MASPSAILRRVARPDSTTHPPPVPLRGLEGRNPEVVVLRGGGAIPRRNMDLQDIRRARQFDDRDRRKEAKLEREISRRLEQENRPLPLSNSVRARLAPRPATMVVQVQEGSSTLFVDTSPMDTVAVLKMAIWRLDPSHRPDRLKLAHQGRVLEDTEVLQDAKVEENSRLIVA
eukprot:EG_transcript_24184